MASARTDGQSGWSSQACRVCFQLCENLCCKHQSGCLAARVLSSGKPSLGTDPKHGELPSLESLPGFHWVWSPFPPLFPTCVSWPHLKLSQPLCKMGLDLWLISLPGLPGVGQARPGGREFTSQHCGPCPSPALLGLLSSQACFLSSNRAGTFPEHRGAGREDGN